MLPNVPINVWQVLSTLSTVVGVGGFIGVLTYGVAAFINGLGKADKDLVKTLQDNLTNKQIIIDDLLRQRGDITDELNRQRAINNAYFQVSLEQPKQDGTNQ